MHVSKKSIGKVGGGSNELAVVVVGGVGFVLSSDVEDLGKRGGGGA